eukprot:11590036-Ditylum_brightwellii.AAC.1
MLLMLLFFPRWQVFQEVWHVSPLPVLVLGLQAHRIQCTVLGKRMLVSAHAFAFGVQTRLTVCGMHLSREP